MKMQNSYVVWRGRAPGIYGTWAEAAAQVQGFAGAQYKAFATRAAAERAWAQVYAEYVGKNARQLRDARLIYGAGADLTGIAVDAACSGNPGVLEYRAVWVESGNEVFRRGPYAEGTNNVGEFLALGEALQFCHRKHVGVPIYSDSRIALNWVKARVCRTDLPQSPRNATLFHRIARVESWLRARPLENRILKWDTEAWGENPADFGRK